ncbi:MAG: class I SAM-dependent methyltransferase [Bacteroidales bacterium]
MKDSNKGIWIWNKFAKHYSGFIKRTLANAYAELYDQIKADVEGVDSVLEVATGPGLIAFEISDIVRHIDAVDLSPQMVAVAKETQRQKSVLNIDFACCDAYNLPFADGKFDRVIASNLLHLLKEPNVALVEMKRVLKSDGKIILPTFCHGESFKSRFISFFMSLSGFKAENKWSVKDYGEYIGNNGFKIIGKRIISGKIPLVYLMVENQN